MTDSEYKQARIAAEALGLDHGTGAGSWVFDGNTSRETYERVLKGIEEGDPEIMDSLPDSPLSGEWADGLTPDMLIRELGYEASEIEEYQYEGIIESYEQAYQRAVLDIVTTTARLYV